MHSIYGKRQKRRRKKIKEFQAALLSKIYSLLVIVNIIPLETLCDG